jgi:hypothetical protein
MARANARLHYFLSWLQKARASANYRSWLDKPVAPKKQIIVEQPDEKPKQREAVSRRPFSGWATQFRCTRLQFILEKLGEAGAHFVRQPGLFPACVTVVIGCGLSAWLIRIGAEEMKNRAPELSGISLQIIKEIKAEQIWLHVASPSRDDLAGIGE